MANDTLDGLVLRPHRIGDIGHIIARHGVLYADEYGWDVRMESLVARTCADFIDTHDPRTERLWVAERRKDGKFVGCVMMFNEKEEVEMTAMLRLLLVEPEERGKGVGSWMVREAVRFARESGYRRCVVWMQKNEAARRIYEREGFEFVTAVEHEAFGSMLQAELLGLRFGEA
ncbi:hypothetical protein MPH_03803 [Macrophomina phaseolina MS6]|uniref:N-acetyltransferase domain-containing protein n=2 Tax=Macrophomina phaseolina TaxID=35725 RepID=K2S941_MACPH|nr:hypothetical protein MPH_03803 [Macrophomina phaseolina MS6]KAH7042571.1 acyl-CoA N-acyltransferase [Macrophomina phaseolina]